MSLVEVMFPVGGYDVKCKSMTTAYLMHDYDRAVVIDFDLHHGEYRSSGFS